MAASACSSDPSTWCSLVEDWTHNPHLARAASWVVAKPLGILALIVIALVIRWLAHRLIDRLAAGVAHGAPGVITRSRLHQVIVEQTPAALERREQRAATMGSLLKSVATTVIVAVLLFMVVAQLGYNIAPLIASAGIVGVALGFGAQNLVKDYLSGIFMIMEDQFGVGDAIVLPAATGTVEAVGLRVTRLRDVNGAVWFVRNGEITAVGNMSQLWARVVLDVPAAYGEDAGRVQEALSKAADRLVENRQLAPSILEPPEVWGVQSWDANGLVVRLVVKVATDAAGQVGRALRVLVKESVEAAGIALAVPVRMVVQPSSAGRPAPDTGPDTASPEPADAEPAGDSPS